MRIDKFLANSGIGSRKEIKTIIKKGMVTVNGICEKNSSVHIDENNDCVAVNDEEIIYKKYIYLMLNKPSGYISAVYDKKFPVVIQFVPEEYAHYDVFPVGRLDIDTEGLLILTNDGMLAHRLLSPKNHVDKTYFVVSEKETDEKTVNSFKKGVVLDDGYKTMPAELKITDKQTESYLTIHEGKFHQVKRMYKAVGNEVLYLKRVKMGGLTLDDTLKKGEIRELTHEELMLLEGR